MKHKGEIVPEDKMYITPEMVKSKRKFVKFVKFKKISEKNKEYFENQIKGLLMIMEDAPENDVMVARSYIKEKLKMILGDGINFHPSIKESLKWT